MMQYDYYAFRKEQLGDRLHELERSDKKSREQAAERTFKINEQDEQEQIEPHLPYLWYEVLGRDLKNSIRDAWQKLTTDQKSKLAKQIQNLKKEQDAFGFTPNPSDLDRLPHLSFMLHVPFKLRKPYLSKDDRTFHLLDNPVRKDKVFQTPMVASTSWKGALRAALWQLGHQKDDEQIIRLFGDAREDEKGQAGRLYFYPTFFDKIGLEVINPHDRKKGTGKNPILIECVPIGATGKLVILYVPFWKIEKNQVTEEDRKKEETRRNNEVAEDLKLVAEGVKAMLSVYGFGAKTSSGFGVAEVEEKGEWGIKANLPDIEETESSSKQPEFLNDDGSSKPEFLNDDGNLKSQGQYKKFCQKQGKTYDENLYKEAKKYWDAKNAKSNSSELELTFKKRDFDSFESLVKTAEGLAEQLIGDTTHA